MEEGNKKKAVQGIAFIVTFIVAFFGTKYVISSFNSTDKGLQTIAKTVNKTCPKMIDNETRLDSASAYHDTLQYYYTIVHVVKGDPKLNLEEAKGFVIKQSQNNLDTRPEMQEFREKDVALKYSYTDKNAQPLFDFTIKPNKK